MTTADKPSSGTAFTCAQCGAHASRPAGHVNRSRATGAPLYCGRACAGLARRTPPKTEEQRRADKAAYDREYWARNIEARRKQKAEWYQANRDPEKEREYRRANMARHLAYCQRPEYVSKKAAYDRQREADTYGPFSETYLLLLDLEREIRSRATAYEVRVAQGYYTRNAQKRRRELWQTLKRN